MTILIDLASEPGQTSIGAKYLESGDGRLFCPECLAQIENDPGFGLAFGGLGTYWMCSTEDCSWFYKELVPNDED